MFEDPRTFREANRKEYGGLFYQMRWLDRPGADEATVRRREILDRLEGRADFLCEGSKPCYGELSPGCRHCSGGTWSCLFINNRCNAACFFCPAPQEVDGMPSTSALTFATPGEYADYCAETGVRGISISGGEPLLSPDRTLAYLRECKKRFGDGCHFWLYTNGTLVDSDTFRRLADEGLDEIRFNIIARDYRTDMVGLAAKSIPVVTVEIPAVPEDSSLLRRAMHEMASAGAKHLNLHQIRCTPYNCRNLIERDYTFLHGPHASVLESELAALDAMAFAADNRLPLPVNYCSFIYRHRYQGDAAARRAAIKTVTSTESVTARGLIRRCSLGGDPERLAHASAALGRDPQNAGQWSRSPQGGPITAVPELLAGITLDGLELHIEYERAFFSDKDTGVAALVLDSGNKIFISRSRRLAADLTDKEAGMFLDLCLGRNTTAGLAGNDALSGEYGGPWTDIAACEKVPYGLQDYESSSMDTGE